MVAVVAPVAFFTAPKAHWSLSEEDIPSTSPNIPMPGYYGPVHAWSPSFLPFPAVNQYQAMHRILVTHFNMAWKASCLSAIPPLQADFLVRRIIDPILGKMNRQLHLLELKKFILIDQMQKKHSMEVPEHLRKCK
ncbi:uncharacterized protein LOC121257683 isoform X2 [Juglans microcarpa x Juglans regia]|uniref:uncharacterized protein LOC121257683 isoform X2 n=1 Tax=Juglans microcarpa x Juglans regia TaxID=2249226 RepID=UPI001B7E4F79|nr:uncharacterized protein LOC121257683 isoform X2 [Juglans microcarpa x Juglans regia]